MEELQQQILTWCDSLEEYLKCSQCEAKLVKDIYQCPKGHLACSSCNKGPPKCCPVPLMRIQNYLAENLAEKMEVILKQIGDNDDDDVGSMCSESSISYNTFSCWIGKCKFQGSIDQIRKHYEDTHSGLYVKHSDDKLPHSTTFFLEYSLRQIMHRLLDIPNVGLFLLQIYIYENGATRVHVFMYESRRNANNFQYKLKIQCNSQNSSVEGIVDTIRIPKGLLSKKGLFIPRAHNLQVELLNSLKFTCLVELDKNPGSTDAKPQIPKSKPRQKDTNVAAESEAAKKTTRKNVPPKKDKLTNGPPQNLQHQPEKVKNQNVKKENPQKVNGAGSGQKNVENKVAGVQNHQAAVNSPLQTTGTANLGRNVGSVRPLVKPVFSPMMNPGGQQMMYQPPQFPHGGVNIPMAGPSQGYPHSPQHIGVPIPGAFPGSNPFYRPTAPVDDGSIARASYPDLTHMKHTLPEIKVPEEAFPRYKRKERIDSRELPRNSSVEKDKCVIS